MILIKHIRLVDGSYPLTVIGGGMGGDLYSGVDHRKRETRIERHEHETRVFQQDEPDGPFACKLIIENSHCRVSEPLDPFAVAITQDAAPEPIRISNSKR